MSKNTRTDPHRPGAIVPAEYDFVLSYNLPTSQEGLAAPSYGINCELDRRRIDADGKLLEQGKHDPDGRCCVIGLLRVAMVAWAATGGTGHCSICGAAFVYGDVWMHRPTGEHIHLGHICSDKYNLLADRSAYELGRDRQWAAAAAQVQKALNKEAREAFLLAHPGLAADLSLDHAILADLSDKLTKYHSLSDKQIALAEKIAGELRNPKPEEVHVSAPIGKGIVVKGEVVAVKAYESQFGTAIKMTVKVQTEAGSWLAWGTMPAALQDGTAKGRQVEFTANLKAGRDAHFALIERPRSARFTDEPAPAPQVGVLHLAGVNCTTRCGLMDGTLSVTDSAGASTCAQCLAVYVGLPAAGL